MNKTILVLIIFFFIPVFAFTQVAAEMDTLLEAKTITTATAARFAMGAAGLLPPELSGSAAEAAAYEQAFSRGWVKRGPEEAITMKYLAYLLMNVFEIKGGIMYSIFRTPRYAYREMLYRKIIQGSADEGMKVSGHKFLQIISSALNYTGEREMMDAILISEAGN